MDKKDRVIVSSKSGELDIRLTEFMESLSCENSRSEDLKFSWKELVTFVRALHIYFISDEKLDSNIVWENGWLSGVWSDVIDSHVDAITYLKSALESLNSYVEDSLSWLG